MYFKVFKSSFLLVLLLSAQYGQAQDWEFGLMLGASNYHGDLAYNIVPGETHPAFGVHMKYNFTPIWSIRPGFMYGSISGSDANYEEYKYRNLHFKSDILELSTVMEFNFVPFGSRILSKDFTAYAMAGIAVFYHDPKAEYKDNWHSLRKLRTEGQNSKQQYGNIQVAIPFGGGFKYNLNKNWVVGFEVGWRKTYTDYLDDVSTLYPDLEDQSSQYGSLSAALSDRSWEVDGVGEALSLAGDERGDPALKDFYFFSNFTFTYRINPITCWPKHKRQINWR
ncbi:MAG: opacity protein-like surface antigen [Bacteroidia bacterium]|jgi:opacity protein-like surface antigen